MINQWVLKLLLLPLALLYGAGVAIRNGLYNIGLLRGVVFNVPVISVGNLSVGGTGKSPHIEYLLRLLHEYLYLAVVSRGYKRKTTGYVEVRPELDATQSGDEPLQFKRKFPHVPVVVSESRSLAIPRVIARYPQTQAILLDDGFQHREVVPGLNIMLTEYNRLYTRDVLLPVGRLREWRGGARRADMIIVTKCPPALSAEERRTIAEEVRREDRQQVFFSRYIYGHPYKMYGPPERMPLRENLDILLVVAIAGTEYLMEYVAERAGDVHLLEYNDHHPFSSFDIGDIARHFKVFSEGRQPIILTTEKDAMRLDTHRNMLLELNLPIYILPVAVSFLDDNPAAFDEAVRSWLLNFKR
jgi:tetraacyldisaccharide 4'-kinase